jgi:hypothetical protein
MNKTIKVTITDNDVLAADYCFQDISILAADSCPIKQALDREYPGSSVGATVAYIGPDDTEYLINDYGRYFIDAYDKDRPLPQLPVTITLFRSK